MRAQDRRPRDQPPLRERRAWSPRRRAATAGSAKTSPRTSGRSPASRTRLDGHGASAARRGARRGVLPRRRVRGAQREAGRGRRARCSRTRATPRADRCGRRPRARTPRSSTRMRDRLDRLRMLVHGIGAWPNPPVRDAERGLRAARSVGAADERALPRRSTRPKGGRRVHRVLRRAPPRRRARDRRHRRQGRRARAARRARRDQPRPALGDRLQVPARAGEHEAARHRRVGRPHRPRDAVRRDGAGARRRIRRAAGDPAQPGRREGQGRADRRHRRAAQGRRRHPRGARAGRRAARRHRARVRHARRLPRVRHPARARERGRHRPALPERAIAARRRCAGASSTSARAARSTSRGSARCRPLRSPSRACPRSPPLADRGRAVRPARREDLFPIEVVVRDAETGLPRLLEDGTPDTALAVPARSARRRRSRVRRRRGRSPATPATCRRRRRRSCSPTSSVAKTKDLWRFLVALNIRHVGPVAARALAAVVRLARRDPRGRRATSSPRSRASAASSPTSLLDWFDVDWHREIVDRWAAVGRAVRDARAIPVPARPRPTGGVLAGLTVVATGIARGVHARGGAGGDHHAPAARRPRASRRRPTSSRPGPGAGSKLGKAEELGHAHHRRRAVPRARDGGPGALDALMRELGATWQHDEVNGAADGDAHDGAEPTEAGPGDVAARLPEDRRRGGGRRRGRRRHRRRGRRGGRPLDGLRRGRGVLRAAHRPAAGGIRPPRRAHGREPLVRQPPRLPLLVRRPADGAELRRGSPSATTPTPRPTARSSRPTSTRARPTRSWAARTPTRARSSRTSTPRSSTRVDPATNAELFVESHDGPVQRAAPQRRRDDVGLRRATTVINYMRLRKGTPPVRRRGRADHGVVLPADAARALHAREELRRLRQLVLRGAVADVLQPVVLPRLDVARIRHEQGAAAATTSGSTHPRRPRSSTGSKRPASPGASTSTSSSSSRSPACCTRPCSSSTGAPSASRR